MEPKFFITGSPGSGKSTVFMRILETLSNQGFKVGGIYTPELRINGERVGFYVRDIASGAQKIMAGVDIESKYRVGKYFIDLEQFESIAIPALNYAENECDVIGVDEIGRMELFSKAFVLKVNQLLSGEKPLLAVIHRNYVEKYKGEGILYTVDVVNRNQLPELIFSRMVRLLKSI